MYGRELTCHVQFRKGKKNMLYNIRCREKNFKL